MKIPGDSSAPGIFYANSLRPGNKSITFVGLKYSELHRLLIEDGWFVIRQTGSHVFMRHPVKPGQLNIPFHGSKEIGIGLLKATLKKAQIITTKR